MKKFFLFFTYIFLVMQSGAVVSIPHLIPNKNTLDQLQHALLYQSGKPLKLHLGCGMTHLSGYINIDYPLEDHSVQTSSGADVFGEITKLSFQDNVLHEVRSHHVFEHFDRATALALLTKWHIWLKKGGSLVIETPDFLGSVKTWLTDISFKRKQTLLRHIFGSQEAFWALHYDGWYQEKFEHVLQALGYKINTISTSRYLDLVNVTVRAEKVEDVSLEELTRRSKELLKEYMVNNSATETTMWRVWCDQFDDALMNMQ